MITNGPWRMILHRLLMALPALFGILVLIFVVLRVLPGDPAALFASSPAAGEQEIAALRQQLGLDRSLPEQFGLYLVDLSKGNLGRSLLTGRPVLADLADRLPASLELIVPSFIVAVVIGVVLGTIAALKPDSWIDHVVRLICTVGISLPAFVTGLLLIYFFYYLAGWAPAPTGRLDMFVVAPPAVTGFILIDALLARDLEAFAAALNQLILPVLTLTFFAVPPLARITRASMLAVMNSDFIRTARSLGLSSSHIVFVYGLRNALLPVLAVLSTTISALIGGSVVIEKVFAWPGISAYAVDALMAGDYAPVQGFVLLVAILYLFVNLIIDILAVLSDPRVSLS
ncbi:ABC transporter permease [Agrobacterium rhizogenes]|nr:ABC transporter permease [Rhizobium rhizogenes]NTG32220.1 ABC transporter permease [Rhizobium rhizogenes]